MDSISINHGGAPGGASRLWFTGIDPVCTAGVGHSIEGEGEDTRLTCSWTTGGCAASTDGGCSGTGAGALAPLAEDKVTVSIDLSGAPGRSKLYICTLGVHHIVVHEGKHTRLASIRS